MRHIALMQTINNLAEAKETVEALADFLKRFEQTLGALGSLTGKSLTQTPAVVPPAPLSQRIGVPLRPLNPNAETPPLPESMQDRVYQVLRSGSAPMTAAEMVVRYQALGWPVPDRKALYRQLLACAYYLSTRRHTLVNNKGKYSIAPPQTAAQ